MERPVKILITGANGQVGYELLRALASGALGPNPHPPLRGTFSRGEKEGVVEVWRDVKHLRGTVSRGEKEGALGPSPPDSRDHSPSPPGEGAPDGREMVRNCEIIPATRNGECAFPLLQAKAKDWNPSPVGRGVGVRVRTCEVLDLADLEGLDAALDRITPDIILNAAAYTAVDKAEDERDLAQRINADAVGALGVWAQRNGARVVHYSTDYVFDGSARQPYREDDAPHPVSAYGRTKLAGELALRDSGTRHLIFRTAWVYAARGKNFLRTMLSLGAERDELRVVDDQVGAPTPARLIAEVTVQALTQWLDDATPARDGIYHLVASGQVSWCGFARAIFARAIPFDPRSFGRGKTGHSATRPHPLPEEGGRAQRGGMSPRIIAITTADYPTKAARPAYSVLDTARLRATFGVELPGWQAGLDGVVADLTRGS